MRCVVLGRGKTVKSYQHEPGDYVMGVNDITLHYPGHLNALVVVDAPGKFQQRRLNAITSAKPDVFLSQVGQYKNCHNYKHIRIQNRLKFKSLWTTDLIPCGVSSPFVAASYYVAIGNPGDAIVLYGADYHQDHRYFKTGYRQVLENFSWLRDMAAQKDIDIFVGHKYSKLTNVLPLWKQYLLPHYSL